MAKKSFKLVKASAALAVTAAALTPVMAAEASTSVVELKSEVVLGGKFKEALALNTPAGVQITWGKHLVTAINKWQTVKGQGSDGKTYIKKLYARNYPLYVLDQDLGEVEAGSELVKPSIRVMYRDGKIYTQAPERYTMSSNYNTKDEGEQKVLISYNHNGNRITKLLTYTVVAGEVSFENVVSSVAQADNTLSVSADVKNLKEGEKVELHVFANKNTASSPIVTEATVTKEGKLNVSKKLPVGTHSFQLVSGEVKSEIQEFTVNASAVQEVKAVNAQTIEVHFNKALDEKTLKANNVDLISIEAATGASNPETVTQSLSADGKVLTLTSSAIFKGEYTVKVPFEKIKDVHGDFVKPVNAKVNVADTTAPTLLQASAIIKDVQSGIQTVTLTFDENIKSIDTVKIAGVNYKPVVAGDKATITIPTPLDASKTYEVVVINVTDNANNVKNEQARALSVTVDSASADVTSVTAVKENVLKVTTSKAVNLDTLKAGLSAKVGTFTANVVSNVTEGEKAGEYLVVLNDSYLFKAGNSDLVTLTFAKDSLVDALGNKNANAIQKAAAVSKDVSAPVVSKVEEVKDAQGKVTGFVLQFTEEVKSPSLKGVKVVNSKGEILPVANVVEDPVVDTKDATKVNFTFKTSAASQYTFELPEGFVTDLALSANKSAKYGFAVAIAEVTPPAATTFVIKSATNKAAVNNEILVDFGTKVAAVGTGSALNPASYLVNGVTLPANTVIEFVGAPGDADYQTKVLIKLPADFVKANDEKATFRVAGIKALDGKTSEAFFSIVKVEDNTAPVLTSFIATDLNKLTLTYSEAVDVKADAVISDELKLVDSKGAVVTFDGYTVKDGKLVLTVENATAIQSVTTVKVDAANQDLVDANGVAQKAEITVSK
ncbi:Ig-like domain-containing protein [Exiguobacterium alkaliphilum]|uniref:Ig-like domain-containing protein n=1 Tax=Exiguobacterium alkaliphilum TaxID=1428684 RepID=UPI003463D66E